MSSLANIGRQLLLKSGSQIISLLSIMYFTRRLSPDQLGNYFYFESLLGMVALISGFGIVGATEKFASEDPDDPRWFSTSFSLLVTLSFFAALFIYVVNEHFYMMINEKYLIIFLISIIVTRIYSLYKNILRAELRAATAGGIDLIRIGILFLSAFLLFKSGLRAASLMIGYLLSHILILPVMAYTSNAKFVSPDLRTAKKLIHFGKYYVINILGMKVFYLCDIIIIGIVLTKADVGRYEIAWRMIFAGMMLNSVIVNTIFSYISNSYSNNDIDSVTSEVRQSLHYILLIPFGTAVGAFFIGQELIALLFTTDYTTPKLVITILGTGFIFQSVYSLFSRSLFAIDKPKLSFYIALFSSSINILINIILIPQFGTSGAAVGTASSYGIAAFTYYLALNRYIDIQIPWSQIKSQITAAVIMGTGLAITLSWFGVPSGTLLLGYLISGSLFYFLVLFTLRGTRSDLLKIARAIAY